MDERVTLFGEMGALFWEQDVDVSDDLGDFDAEKDDASFLLGAGASYQVVPDFPLAVTLRYNRYFEVGDERRTGHDNDIDRVAAGVAFGF
jgi:opacity protein-like surface antigen